MMDVALGQADFGFDDAVATLRVDPERLSSYAPDGFDHLRGKTVDRLGCGAQADGLGVAGDDVDGLIKVGEIAARDAGGVHAIDAQRAATGGDDQRSAGRVEVVHAPVPDPRALPRAIGGGGVMLVRWGDRLGGGGEVAPDE